LSRLTALVALVSDAEHVPQRAGQVTQVIWGRERSRVRMALAIDVMRFGLHRDLRKIR
jgi:hypothetical protein